MKLLKILHFGVALSHFIPYIPIVTQMRHGWDEKFFREELGEV